MFFIFGIEEKEKELREFANIVCADCGRYSRAVLILHILYPHISMEQAVLRACTRLRRGV